MFATAEFYRDVLGFTFDEFFGDPPSFTIVERDDACIMFRQVRPAKPAVARPNRSVMDETFDAYINVLKRRSARNRAECQERRHHRRRCRQNYDMRELVVRDCNGYVLAFRAGMKSMPCSARPKGTIQGQCTLFTAAS